MIRSPVLHATSRQAGTDTETRRQSRGQVSNLCCGLIPRVHKAMLAQNSDNAMDDSVVYKPSQSVPVRSSHASVWHDEAVCEHRMIWRTGLVLIRLLTSS